jgi:hypothetical protein
VRLERIKYRPTVKNEHTVLQGYFVFVLVLVSCSFFDVLFLLSHSISLFFSFTFFFTPQSLGTGRCTEFNIKYIY